MSTANLPFSDLAERISQHESELAKLRQEFEARQSQLTQLTRRKEELQAQLQAVESEIEAVGNNSKPSSVATAAPTPPQKPAAAKAQAKLKAEVKASMPATGDGKRVTLAAFIINCVKHAKGPVTVKDLAQEIVRQKYPTSSSDVAGMVQTRVGELVKKGFLKRAGDQAGVILGQTRATVESAPAKGIGGADSKGHKARTISKKVAPTKANGVEKKKSLKVVLSEVLAKSSRPLTTDELAERVLQSGYQTASKDFKSVIWVGIGSMENVERVAEGYRLKKGKMATKKKP